MAFCDVTRSRSGEEIALTVSCIIQPSIHAKLTLKTVVVLRYSYNGRRSSDCIVALKFTIEVYLKSKGVGAYRYSIADVIGPRAFDYKGLCGKSIISSDFVFIGFICLRGSETAQTDMSCGNSVICPSLD